MAHCMSKCDFDLFCIPKYLKPTPKDDEMMICLKSIITQKSMETSS